MLQRIAGRLFHHAGPCLGDVDASEGSRHRSQDDPEAFVSSEWLGLESMLAEVESGMGQWEEEPNKRLGFWVGCEINIKSCSSCGFVSIGNLAA